MPSIDAKYITGPPCALFNKRRAITAYKLRWNSDHRTFEHYELFRVTNETPNEYYVLPIETLQKQKNFHISYHASGAFHWREVGQRKIVPACGEADARRASLFVQATAHLYGQLDGYCIARGRDVSDSSLDRMIDILDGYILPPLKLIGINLELRSKKRSIIPMIDTPFRRRAAAIKNEATRDRAPLIISREELRAAVSKEAPSARFIETEPKMQRFMVHDLPTFQKIIRVAQALVGPKIEDKEAAFWTK